MRAFIVGLFALLAVAVVSGIGFLVYSLFILLGFILQFLVSAFLVVFFIWAFGKLIIFLWGKAKKPKK